MRAASTLELRRGHLDAKWPHLRTSTWPAPVVCTESWSSRPRRNRILHRSLRASAATMGSLSRAHGGICVFVTFSRFMIHDRESRIPRSQNDDLGAQGDIQFRPDNVPNFMHGRSPFSTSARLCRTSSHGSLSARRCVSLTFRHCIRSGCASMTEYPWMALVAMAWISSAKKHETSVCRFRARTATPIMMDMWAATCRSRPRPCAQLG